MRAADLFPTSDQLDAADQQRALFDAQLAEIDRRLAQAAAARAAGLVPETDRDGCRCGKACAACGNCVALSVGCSWDRCDGNGFVYPGNAEAEAIAATDQSARLRRARRGW